MKSITKSYSNIASGTNLGLTQEQAAGLYSVYIDGSQVVNSTSTTVKGFAYRWGGGDNNNPYYTTRFLTYSSFASGYNVAFYTIGVNAVSVGATLESAGKFTGSITFYYFG